MGLRLQEVYLTLLLIVVELNKIKNILYIMVTYIDTDLNKIEIFNFCLPFVFTFSHKTEFPSLETKICILNNTYQSIHRYKSINYKNECPYCEVGE